MDNKQLPNIHEIWVSKSGLYSNVFILAVQFDQVVYMANSRDYRTTLDQFLAEFKPKHS